MAKNKKHPVPRLVNRTPPEYSRRIAALRTEILQLTQPEFAKALRLRRGAVARWETGDREPSQRSYTALAEFAERRGVKEDAEFFRRQIHRKDVERHIAQWNAGVRHYVAALRALAAAGNAEANRLIKLSRLDRIEFSGSQFNRLLEAHASLGEDAFADAFRAVAFDAEVVRILREAAAIDDAHERSERR